VSDTILGFDTDQTLTNADAENFYNAGYQFVGRYISPGYHIVEFAVF